MAGRWHQVGEITVDAGMIWVGDPCLLADDSYAPSSAPRPTRWKAFVDWLYNDDQNGRCPLPGGAREHPLGVIVRSGHGDGCYPVEVRRNREGDVAEVRVRFLT